MAIATPSTSGTSTPILNTSSANSTRAPSEQADTSHTMQETSPLSGNAASTTTPTTNEADAAAMEKIPLYAAEAKGKAGWWNCQFNLTNAAIGAGLVCLPKQFQTNGYVLGIALMVFVGILSGMSHKFLAVSGAWTGRKTFRGLSKEVLGPFGEVLYVALVCVLLLGPMTAYFNLSASYITEVVTGLNPNSEGQWYLNPWFVTGVLGLAIKFPLSLIQPISKLSKVSMVALLIIVYTIVLVIVRGLMEMKTMADADALPHYEKAVLSMNLLDAVAVIGFSYANHFIYLEITSEMKTPTNRRQTSLIVSSNAFTTLVYAIVALTGYFGFAGRFKSDVLTAMKGTDVDVCRIVFALMMCLSYPLILAPARDNLTWLIHYFFQPEKLKQSHIRAKVAKTTGGNIIVTSFRRIFPETVLFYALTVGLLLTTYVLSNSFKNINDVLAVFFSLTGGLLVFVFPSLFWMMLATRMPILQQRASHEGVWQSSQRLNFFQRWCMPRNLDVPKGELVGFEMEDKEDLQARATFAVEKPVSYTIAAWVNILFGLFLTFVGTYSSLRTVIKG